MGLIEVIGIAVTLALDAFAVSSVSGMSNKNFKLSSAVRMATCFGAFQLIMTLLGYLLGTTFAEKVALIDHYIAFALLLFIGGKMVVDSFRGQDKDGESKVSGVDTLPLLLMQGIATSIDALATGVTFAFDLKIDLFAAAGIIGIVAFVLSFAGGYLGRFIGSVLNRWASVVGGLVLIGIGTKMLIEGIIG